MRFYLFLLAVLMMKSSAAQAQNDSIRIAYAEHYYNDKKFDLALLYADSLQHDYPDDINIAILRAGLLKELGKSNVANKLIDKFSDTGKLRDMTFYYNRAVTKISVRLFPEAEKDLNKALRIADENSPKYKEVLFKMGDVHYHMLQYEKTHDDMQLYLAHWPDDEDGLLLMCNALNWMNSTGEIMMYLERGVKLYPNSALLIGNLAYRYQNKGDYEKAIELNNKAIALLKQEDNASVYYNNRGYEKFKMNDLEAAMQDVNKAMEIDSSNSFIYRNRALIYIALKQTDKACADIETALQRGFTEYYGKEALEMKKQYCH
jgi:tetratricopeptide (TPR) repeat protein